MKLNAIPFLFSALLVFGSCEQRSTQQTKEPGTSDQSVQLTQKPLTGQEIPVDSNIVATFTMLEDSMSGNKIKEPKDSCYECQIQIDVSANWMDITYPGGSTQRLRFKNQRGPSYGLNFQVKTNLKKTENIIYDYYYIPVTGGVNDTKKLGVTTDCDNLAVNYYLYTGQKKMTGKFGICYTRLSK